MQTERLRTMIAGARGEHPCDLLLRNARVVNVFTRRIEVLDVGVAEGCVVGFGTRAARETVDLEGRYLLPGLVDAHVHPESGLLEPGIWATELLRLGTTTVIADPHEIANVLGVAGIRFLILRARRTPLSFRFMAPSCVPATHLETTGATLSAEETDGVLGLPGVLGLGEVMNVPSVLRGDEETLAKIAAALRRGLLVDGHAPRLTGNDLDAYLAAGIRTDHECLSLAEAREKIARGMQIIIREGSTARNLEALAPLLEAETAENCMLCTDDRSPADLRARGHINSILRRAVELGCDPITAIRCATRVPARHYGLRDRGAVAPGFRADLVVCPDLEQFRPDLVFAGGECVAREGRCLWQPPAWEEPWPNRFDLPELTAGDFRLLAAGTERPAIGIIPGQLVTVTVRGTPGPRGAEVRAEPDRDVLKLVVVERYSGRGGRSGALVRGFGLRLGALASSVAHDAHNVIAVGADDDSLSRAVNLLARHGGGLAAVGPDAEAVLPLPVAGLMSDQDAATVCDSLEALNALARDLGCTLRDPFMQLSFLALAVIPALKLTDRGLVDVDRFGLVDAYCMAGCPP
ncbi:MAG: adenine deaminase [Lentisphaeria bacterium]|nr:adenine deaminase [Lentisphaeria bacterium]